MTREATSDPARAHQVGEAREPRFIYAVGALDRGIRRQLVAVLRPFELTIAEYTALSLMRRRGGYSNAQLAKRAFVSPQAMHQVITSLEDRGLLERTPSTSHGSVLDTFLTRSGRALLDRCDAAVDIMEESMLTRGPAELRAQTVSLLLECAKHLGTSAADRSDPP